MHLWHNCNNIEERILFRDILRERSTICVGIHGLFSRLSKSAGIAASPLATAMYLPDAA